MALLVQKFGGTSVGDVDRIQAVADRVCQTHAAGHSVVVVLSAMTGETDRLIQLARTVHPEPLGREYATLVTTGEQVTIALLSLAIKARGVEATSYTGAQVPIYTDTAHHKARILSIDPTRLRNDLQKGIIPIVAGFQGVASNGDVTTLGRGGSDTTAVAIAAAIKADECQIYTDVDGVYTADPRMVRNARRLNRITFEEMLELASLGAKVLQTRSVQFAGKYRVPLRVLSSFGEEKGTLITFDDDSTAGMENPLVTGIAFNRSEAKLTLVGAPDKPGVVATVIGKIGAAHIDIDMIVQNVAVDGCIDLTFTVHRDEYARAHAILGEIAQTVGARSVCGDTNIAKLSLVGVGMRSHTGVASRMFDTLSKDSINVQLIATSEIKISVVIDEKYLELGVRALHAAFHLGVDPKEEFDPNTHAS